MKKGSWSIGRPVGSAVNQEVATEETDIPEREGNHSDSMALTEVGVCTSTRRLQDLITNAISALRTDIVKKKKTRCSNQNRAGE